jgi:flavin-dependent dehydrogenase
VDCDLLVVGGGPVGLGTAIEAALAGLGVTLLERRGSPVDKACGEGLMPPARQALARLGVTPEGWPFNGIRYLTPAASAQARFRAGPGLGVRRTGLSAALSARAEQVGVTRLQATAGPPVQGAGWVQAAGVRGRWLVAADGLHSPIRRALGLDRPVPGPARFGLRRHYRVAPWTDLVEVHWSGRAEAYVTPVAADLVGVAVLADRNGSRPAPHAGRPDWLAGFPVLQHRLAGAEPVGRVLGAGPLRQRSAHRVAGRVLLAGDAAGYVDALTGEGIAVGLLAARELVRCLLLDRPQDYEPAWRRASRQYRALTAGLLWASRRPVLRRALVPAAQRLPLVFDAVVNRLA